MLAKRVLGFAGIDISIKVATVNKLLDLTKYLLFDDIPSLKNVG
jgi:hypothetical protein